MNVHYLKTWPQFMQLTATNRKPWEIRQNDRDFLPRDFLCLMEWDPETRKYTGFVLRRTIAMVLPAHTFPTLSGIEPGMVILLLDPAPSSIPSSSMLPSEPTIDGFLGPYYYLDSAGKAKSVWTTYDLEDSAQW